MRKNHIAELILGLVTSRDRAASAVGDLMEQSTSRGIFWFWSRILRILVSLLWLGLTGNPARVTGVAFFALAVDVAATLLLAGLTGVAFFVAAYNGHRGFNSVWWTIGLYMPTLFISPWIGRMFARWAPGRELPACLAYALLGLLFSLTATFVSGSGLSAMFWVFLGDAAQRTPVLAGALWGRHRRLIPG